MENTKDDLWAEMLAAGEVGPGASVRYWTHVESRRAAEQEMRSLPSAQTHAVIAYGTRDNLEWLYRIPGGDGDGKGEDAMRAFMKEHGDGLG